MARVIRRLGGNVVAVFPAGGPIGGLLQTLLIAESVTGIAVPIAGDTREDITIDEQITGAQYRFVLPGPQLRAGESESLIAALEANLPARGFVVASGSLPPGLDPGFYGAISRLVVASGARFVLDSSGPALAAALNTGAFMIKPSLRELRELTGQALTQERSWLEAARALISRYPVQWVALTLGEMGALLVSDSVALRATAPKIAPVSTVGAGDSFLGALVWALAEGQDVRMALRFAVASGTAAMLARGTDLSHPVDIESLLAKVEVHDFESLPAFA